MSSLLRSCFTDHNTPGDALENLNALKESPIPNMWTSEMTRAIYDEICEFVERYGRPPSLDALRDWLKPDQLKHFEEYVATPQARVRDAEDYRTYLDSQIMVERENCYKAAAFKVMQIISGEAGEVKEEWAGETLIHKLAGIDDAVGWFAREQYRIDKAIPSPYGDIGIIEGPDVKKEKIEFIHRPLIAKGRVTLFEGDGGVGKSTILSDIAARITRGEPLFGQKDQKPYKPMHVVWASTEEEVGSSLIPRLEACGADISMMSFTEQDKNWTAENMRLIVNRVRKYGDIVVVLDHLKDLVGSNIKDYEETSVRQAMLRLQTASIQHNITWLGIRHWTKGTGSASARGAGSMAWRNVAHAVLACGRYEDKFYISDSKLRFGIWRKAINYDFETRLDPDLNEYYPRIVWGDIDESINADDLAMAKPTTKKEREEKKSKLDEAIDFLHRELRNGPKHSAKLQALAKEEGISYKTLRNAREEVCKAFRKDNKWYWELKGDPNSKNQQLEKILETFDEIAGSRK